MAWRLIHSDRVKREVIAMSERARQEGRLNSVKATLMQLLGQLANDPFAIGEPNNRLKIMDLLLCVVIEDSVVIRYAIDEQRQWVYLRQIVLLP